MRERSMVAPIAVLTALALVSFAANSILCRLALSPDASAIDPASFTAIRLVSGALVLVAILSLRALRTRVEGPDPQFGDWISGAMLFAYAAAFSLAYLGLKAGTGALILFGSVQATMLLAAIAQKQNPRPVEWIGLVLALAGLVYLVAPGLSAPPLDRAALMIFAGIAWGVYSLRGRSVSDPIRATAGNFVRAAPLGLLLLLASLTGAQASPRGVALAVASGALTSGIGYVLWYAVVPTLGATRAAILQLTVPILAAAGGVVLLGEVLTFRLALATLLTVSGVAVAIVARRARQTERPQDL
jgi:drug/metabolite transporter (DMT)-like permease